MFQDHTIDIHYLDRNCWGLMLQSFQLGRVLGLDFLLHNKLSEGISRELVFLGGNKILQGKLFQSQFLMDNIFQLYIQSLEMSQQGTLVFIYITQATSILNCSSNQLCRYHRLISILDLLKSFLLDKC